MRKVTLAAVALLLLLLTVLSFKSGYEIHREGYEVNLSIITMLTPVGLVINSVGESELRPYYFEVLARDGMWSSVSLFLLVLACVALALFCLGRES